MEAKTWMPGTRPGMTTFGATRYFIDLFSSQTLRMTAGKERAVCQTFGRSERCMSMV